MKSITTLLLPLAILLWCASCGRSPQGGNPSPSGNDSPSVNKSNNGSSSAKKLSIAFITNQIADFWKIAEVGCLDAAEDLSQDGLQVEALVKMPPEASAVVQKQIIEDLLAGGVDGIAISPIDADNQKDLIDRAANQVPLITHDSDAPGTKRLMYIGMDNYKAGRMCGELVKQALPDGGNVIIFIGRLEQDNSKYRRQGLIDELMGRTPDRTRFDPPDAELKGDKFTILTTFTDQGKPERCKEQAADAINTYPKLDAMVGLFEYNPPACYQALKQAGKLGQIKLIGFDENEVTLQAIKDGTCEGTIVQDPYQYGYQSIKILASIIQGDRSVIPENRFIDIPPRKITKENVDAFWADLKAKTGG